MLDSVPNSIIVEILQALKAPDFAGWVNAITLAASPDHKDYARVVGPDDRAVEAALREIAFSLAPDDPAQASWRDLDRVILLAAEIARAGKPHVDAGRMSKAYCYFDDFLKREAGATLAALVVGAPPPSDPAVTLRVLRPALGEFLTQLWTILREGARLPLLTASRVKALREDALQLAGSDPSALQSLRALAGLFADAHFTQEASDIADALSSAHPTSTEAFFASAEFAIRNNDASQAATLLDRWPVLSEAFGESQVRLQLHLMLLARQFEHAVELIDCHWGLLARKADSLAIALAFPLDASARARLMGHLMDLLASPATPKAVMNIALLQLVSWGDDQAAADALGNNQTVSEDGIGVWAHILNSGLLPPWVEGESAQLFDRSPIALHRHASSDRALIVFGALGGANIEMIHRFLRRLDCHIVYVRDHRRTLCLDGVSGFGGSYQESLKWLSTLLERLGARHVHTLGDSAGGMSALMYGIDLGAQSVLAFGAPTSMTQGMSDADRRGGMLGRRLRRIVPEHDHDLREKLLRHPARPRVILRYGDYPQHILHANHIADVPGVELRPVENWNGNDSMLALILREQFDAELRDALSQRRFVA